MTFLKRSILVLLLLFPVISHAELQIVATLPALGQIAETVAGEDGEVKVLARVGQDPHFVPPKPTLARHLARADLLFSAGLALESGWLPSLIEVARNQTIRPGASGYFEGASVIDVLGAKAGVDRSMGDVHPEGNPHWWLDPIRGSQVAIALADRLATIDPANGDNYRQRAAAFASRLHEMTAAWKSRFSNASPVVSYHESYRYFSERFAIPVIGFIEPKPGVEASPAHLDSLVSRVKAEGVRQLWVEPYHVGRVAKRIAQLSGAPLIPMPDANEGHGSEGYIQLIDMLLQKASGD
ncbi:metal ABC transporter substrate-binding protein [Mariprofundus sp. KV]|uniref:metal ABC transporter substrate-binding protein n=1 Tax=Mariprofundus sp. KV TaxID=2608715 RepID=UPI0015A2E845|nr:metal ABC transporter substrate-binding protein [Mariprofundus sp. KV]NWF37415.1 zinc ABC transporter substrate-binding protein [Mariprofundus sp. KV]